MQFILQKLPYLITLIFLFSPFICHSSITLDSNDYYLSILKVDHFNDDETKDTLIAIAGEYRNFKPRFIIWGNDTTSSDIPDSLKVRETEINYPYWEELKVMSNIFNINSQQDTLMDIIIVYWGKISDGVGGNKDTVTSQCIFGQHGLDTISIITLNEIDTFQYDPFMAMDMRMNHEYRNGKIRNLNHVTSYEVKRINIDTEDTSGTPPEKIAFYNNMQKNIPEIRIYPNPAVYYTNLEMNKAMPGNYEIVITSLEGNIVLQQMLKVETSSELIERLDLEYIQSGFYILKITSERQHIGTFQLIIVK